MTYVPKSRPHLVERAVEALGATGALGRLNQPAAHEKASSPQSPAPARVIGWDALRQAGLAVRETGAVRSRLAEEISIVQQHLLLTMKKVEPADGRSTRSILVTSARPGEGKTFTSLNLACSMAASGATRVLLVDADGKRHSMTELLGVGDAPGLRLLATGEVPHPASLVLPTAQPRLSFLPYGTSVEGVTSAPPGQMLATALLRMAAALPDHVLIIDSPPCLSTSDPSSLAPMAGQVLMVVEAEKTQRNEVEAALDMVDACPILQLMLNRTQLMANDTFGAYGTYGAYDPRPGD